MTKLTVGMATAFDFQGVFHTVHDLKMYHPEVAEDIEIVIVDNTPSSKSGDLLRGNISNGMPAGFGGFIYHPFMDVQGTSAPRNKVFDLATSDNVLCIDSHVRIVPGAIKRLIDYYDDNPGTNDLLQGPLLYDSHQTGATHFNPQWQGQMYGTWGQAWRCPCGDDGVCFSPSDNSGKCVANLLDADSMTPITSCHACGKELPETEFTGHENVYRDSGYLMLGFDQSDPFDIPSQGLGLFSCRKDAWLGFHSLATGFGGEEGYIHQKFRDAGCRTLCLPFLRWHHRFNRECQEGQYVLSVAAKVRNYILEWQELGRGVDDIYQHFVSDEKAMSESMWRKLVADPEGFDESSCSTCGGKGNAEEFKHISTIEEAGELVEKIERDLNQHVAKLTELAGQVSRVTDISIRRESAIALAAGGPEKINVYNAERGDGLLLRVAQLAGDRIKITGNVSPEKIDDTDLLFINTRHTQAQLTQELMRYSQNVSRYIVMHNTAIYGQRGEDGGPGLMAALSLFLTNNPEWSVVYQTQIQHGLVVISKNKDDKPKLPSVITMAKNLAVHAAEYIADGAENVSEEQYKRRLEICSICPTRNGANCSACGCVLAVKAKGRAMRCDLGLWENSDEEETTES